MGAFILTSRPKLVKGRNEIGFCEVDRADQHFEAYYRFAASNVAAVGQHLRISPDRGILEDFLQDRANTADIRSHTHACSVNYRAHLVFTPFDPSKGDNRRSGSVIVAYALRTSKGCFRLAVKECYPHRFRRLVRDGC